MMKIVYIKSCLNTKSIRFLKQGKKKYLLTLEKLLIIFTQVETETVRMSLLLLLLLLLLDWRQIIPSL